MVDTSFRIRQLPRDHVYTPAESQLFNDNIKLVYRMIQANSGIIKHLRSLGCDNDEVFQIGCFGLLSSCRDGKFKEEYQLKFSTYACTSIKRAWLSEIKQRTTKKAKMLEFGKDKFLEFQTADEKEVTEYIEPSKISELLEVLTNREKLFITLYFGLNGDSPMNLKQISEREGIVKETVRINLVSAYEKIRTHLQIRLTEDMREGK